VIAEWGFLAQGVIAPHSTVSAELYDGGRFSVRSFASRESLMDCFRGMGSISNETVQH
jgi:hypothetical protein